MRFEVTAEGWKRWDARWELPPDGRGCSTEASGTEAEFLRRNEVGAKAAGGTSPNNGVEQHCRRK
jgi:hypothetical protein